MIEIKHLTKAYKRHVVLDDVNITIPDTGISFLMGENGSGKTTLLKSILSLERYEGEILFDGKGIKGAYGEISAVYDDSPLYPSLTGYQNITVLCNREVSKKDIDAVAFEFLTEMELKKKTRGYSYGQRKKLSIVMAFLNASTYIFMDEVSNGLDYETMKLLKNKLKSHAESRLLFLTGHQFDFYNEIVDHIFMLKDKQINCYHIDEFAPDERKLEQIYEKIHSIP